MGAKIDKIKKAAFDCTVSQWSKWTKCNRDCDEGTQKRTRTVVTKAENGGEPCPALVDKQSCFIKHCERCGDAKVVGQEECDDGNRKSGDGCSDICHVEPGWSCNGGSTSSTCNCEKCGNGKIGGLEECDDKNFKAGDGCDDSCKVETGYVCKGPPSKCMTLDEFREQIDAEIFNKRQMCHADHHQELFVTNTDTGADRCRNLQQEANVSCRSSQGAVCDKH